MRFVEVRRHTMRRKPGQNLSQAGVSLARRVGETMGTFERVITSSIPRAYETAIAMGFAVDEQDERLSAMPDDIEVEVAWDAGFAPFAAAVRKGGKTAQFAAQQAEFWRSIAAALSDSGAALLITHGGIIEAGAVACLPDADHATWGRYCAYCEGVRLHYENGRFVNIAVLRVS